MSSSERVVRLPNGDEVPWDRKFVTADKIAEAMGRETKKFEKWLRRERRLRDPATPDYIEPLVPRVDGTYELLAWRLVDVFRHYNFPYAKDAAGHADYDWDMLNPHNNRGRFTTRG